ncbi:MAG: hypothetical protein MZU97_26515 [Bacillus subtilis]|nr:hypothetical protein [Bacillus subtilis]
MHLFVYDVAFAVGVANALSLFALGVALFDRSRPNRFKQDASDLDFALLYYLGSYLAMFFVEWVLLDPCSEERFAVRLPVESRGESFDLGLLHCSSSSSCKKTSSSTMQPLL